MLFLVGHDLVELPLDGREDVHLADLAGDHAAERLVRGMQVRLDEARMDRGAMSIDRARPRERASLRAVLSDVDDAPAADGDGAVTE